MLTTDLQKFYIGLYSEYILDTGLNGFEIAKAMLAVLPGGLEYNSISKLSETRLELHLGTDVLTIEALPEYPDVVSLTIGDDTIVAWDNYEIDDFLNKHAVFPKIAEMLTLDYLTNWNEQVQSASLSDDAWTQSLAVLLDTRLVYLH